MTIDEQFCATVQAISPVQEIGISHVGLAVFVIEPDRQQAIIIQCLSAERETRGGLKAPSPPRWIACPFARPRAARKGSSVSRLLKAYSLHLPLGRCRTRGKGHAREGPLLGSAHDKSSGHSSPSGDRTTHVELLGNRDSLS